MRRTTTAILMMLWGGCGPTESTVPSDGPMTPDSGSQQPAAGSTAGSTGSTTGFVPVTTGSTTGSTGFMPVTTGFVPVTTGTGGTTTGATGGTTTGTTGTSGGGQATTGPTGGAQDAGSTGAGAESDGGPQPGNPGDEFDKVRQVCVDTINMYRATLDLAPIVRADTHVELCSDDGAKKDADNNAPHSSAFSCPGRGAQNTCPGWPVGGRNPTLADALNGCLAAMWAEDEPPEGREKCMQDYFDGDTACFLAHGHYLNMSDVNAKNVACGFYDMGGGKFWMNQDFGSR